MGKKRRVFKSPKFANLRKHPKYAGMVAAREQKKEESYEVVVEQPKPETVKEAEIVEVTPEPKVVKLEKPKPIPEMKAAPKKAAPKKAELKAVPNAKASTKKKQ